MTTQNTEAATPETDAKASPHIGFYSCATVPADFARRLERERDEARQHLRDITEYGTEEINAAVELRQKLATALLERDEAREKAEKSKAYKRVLKETNAQLKRERDEARERASKLAAQLLTEMEGAK